MEEVKIQSHSKKKESSFYKERRKQIYLLLERPQTKLAMVYHLTSFILIIGSLVISVLATIEHFDESSTLKDLMLYYELTLLSVFMVEFLLRLWCCSYVSRYKGLRGRIRFMKSFYMIVDAFVILSTTITAILQINASYFTILRITRFMQILRILRIDRQRGDLRLMINVVRQHSKELFTCYFVGFIILFAGTYIVYVLEKVSDEDITITNMADGLYWAIISVTSVGYGDFSPVTWQGKFATGLFVLTGCAFFALPAGILGSGFALQVDKQKKEQRYMKVRNPAARLLQTVWRNHALKSDYIGPTWHYLLPQLKDQSSTTKSHGALSIKSLIRDEFDRLRKSEPVPFHPIIAANEIAPDYDRAFESHSNNNARTPKIPGNLKLKRDPVKILKREELIKPQIETETDEEPIKVYVKHTKKKKFQASKRSTNDDITIDVHSRYKIAIRFLLKLKYCRAVKIFKRVRHPYINVQDLIERTAQSHIDMLAHIREMKEGFENLQIEFETMRHIVMGQKGLIPVVEKESIPVAKEKDKERMEPVEEENENLDLSDMKIYVNDNE